MVKYDAWKIFEVDKAQDCESINKLLRDVKDARLYMFNGDGPSQLKSINQTLKERKSRLGCA